jgi:MSHA pilin protein MshA
MRTRQSGFTLIELIIVIIILGILAATAAPKLLDISGEAEVAANKGALGALKSSATIYYAKSDPKAWPTGTQLGLNMDPVFTCGGGILTHGDFNDTFTLATGDCTTAISGTADITCTTAGCVGT